MNVHQISSRSAHILVYNAGARVQLFSLLKISVLEAII